MSRSSMAALCVCCVLVAGCDDSSQLELDGRHIHGSLDEVKEAYRFAAERPDLLDLMPCFCGCEDYEHKAVTSCFVRRRGDGGAVAAWDYHGSRCALCVEVVLTAIRLEAAGQSKSQIRQALESQYLRTGKKTPTPPIM